jgi:hypothetical protein
MTKKRPTRKTYPTMDFARPVIKGTWQGMYTCWTNPAMWSDQVVYRTLRQVGGKPYTARDVRSIIRSYCRVVREQLKKQQQNW